MTQWDMFDVRSIEWGKHEVILKNTITGKVHEKFGFYATLPEAEVVADKLQGYADRIQEETR